MVVIIGKWLKNIILKKKLKEMIGNNEWVAIQGEVYGPSIQKNPYKLNSRIKNF